MTGRSGLFHPVHRLVWCVAPLLAICLAGCGGSEYRFGNVKPTITDVTVFCTQTNVQSGQAIQCAATVTGTGHFSARVNWSVTAGMVTDTGVFTAPIVSTTTNVTVKAVSVQDPTKSGSTNVSVNGVPTTNNVQSMVVDSGPMPQTFLATNVGFVSVTVCVPGSSNCQTIDHVLVDTGSTGLRLLSSSSGGPLTIPLPNENDSSGNPLLECAVFGSGYTWGNVVRADIKLAGETAASVPVQVIIPSTSAPAVPASCSNQTTQGNSGDSVEALGANGILGVGLFAQDCGTACTSANQTIPPVYYDCRSGCTPTYTTLAQQVTHPVTLFASDNNGVLIKLPAVPNGGSSSVTGSLIFGIGTQGNNALGSATVYTVPNNGIQAGQITTIFNGTSYPASFLDSGSNGIFFLDSATTGIPQCASPYQIWYCPTTSPDNLSAMNMGSNGHSGTVNFSIEDASTLFQGSNAAFSTLGAPFPGSVGSAAFDWGLAFFYGRSVFTAIDGMSTPGGSGPYFAY